MKKSTLRSFDELNAQNLHSLNRMNISSSSSAVLDPGVADESFRTTATLKDKTM